MNATAPEEIDLMNDEVKEILGAPPRWIVRRGNSLLLGVVLLLIGLAALIKYPETLAGRALVTPVFPVTLIRTPAGMGPLAWHVRDGDTVRTGQTLFNELRSPATGKVLFQRLAENKETLPEGVPLLLIVPLQRDYEAVVSLPAAGSGKVRMGQTVTVALDNFQSLEFGQLTGVVLSLPQAHENTVSFSVRLDRHGQTTFKKELPLFGPSEGMATILTADKRLISQLFSFLK